MKVIEKNIPARTIVSFQCEVCGAKYRTERAARKCEERKLEKQEFKVGDKVTNTEERKCSKAISSIKSYYHFRGIVVDVIGPSISDMDYEIRHLDGVPDRVNGHVYQYVVAFICPICKRSQKLIFYTPELTILV